MKAVLALDLGTSSCKGGLYSASGEAVAFASAPYPVHRPAPGFVEQNPQDYLDAAQDVCRPLVSRADVSALGLSTHTPPLAFCDPSCRSLGPAILWQDQRAG